MESVPDHLVDKTPLFALVCEPEAQNGGFNTRKRHCYGASIIMYLCMYQFLLTGTCYRHDLYKNLSGAKGGLVHGLIYNFKVSFMWQWVIWMNQGKLLRSCSMVYNYPVRAISFETLRGGRMEKKFENPCHIYKLSTNCQYTCFFTNIQYTDFGDTTPYFWLLFSGSQMEQSRMTLPTNPNFNSRTCFFKLVIDYNREFKQTIEHP